MNEDSFILPRFYKVVSNIAFPGDFNVFGDSRISLGEGLVHTTGRRLTLRVSHAPGSPSAAPLQEGGTGHWGWGAPHTPGRAGVPISGRGS